MDFFPFSQEFLVDLFGPFLLVGIFSIDRVGLLGAGLIPLTLCLPSDTVSLGSAGSVGFLTIIFYPII
ncbi:hypothetical protein FAI40_01775 [Acetobacteraceae bacterium]|nr:hypothetical protein FAI40_01775 [Acetobacteraceae bacterium]